MRGVLLLFSWLRGVALVAWSVPMLAYANLLDDMRINGGVSANISSDVSIQDNLFRTVQSYLFGLVGILTVGVCLWIAWTLIDAEGKPDAQKKAWKALTYVAVGLAVIPLSYVVVRIVTGLNIQ